MKSLQDILNFSTLLNKFREVERVIPVQNKDQKENDAEHSYQLAMLAWYIVDTNKLSLNKDLIIKYAMIHDFVEVYAGDTYLFSTDQNHLDTKKQREYDASIRLKKEFTDFEDMHSLIEQYEKREDKESKFVYALDKIIPMINVYLDNGKAWRKLEISLQMLIEHKKDKVSLSPEIEFYFNEFITLLKEQEEELFNQN